MMFNLDIDKLVTIKGLAIRTTPIIPDMKIGMRPGPLCFLCLYIDVTGP
jgi:hypothetical protein